MKLPVVEIYPAVQSEGNHRTPAVFVRSFGCNLRCGFNLDEEGKGRCDTAYAVYKEREKVQLMEIDNVVESIISHAIPHVVFTGGEPTMFQKQLIEIISKLPSYYFIEIETNGTKIIDSKLQFHVNQFNISVKLKSSNQWKGFDKFRINYESLQSFPAKKSTFKFVITSEKDLNEIKEIEKIRPDIPITLMPEGETRDQVLTNIKPTMKLAMKNGYGFTNRDHILAFDDERGV